VLLHVRTTKGKGYEKAEERSDIYHGVGKDHASGTGAFSKALGETLVKLIEKDQNIVAITAGMKDGTGLTAVEKVYPDNFFDMGIAEEYAVTFASGLSAGGLKPVVAMYSTFLQRAYDEVLHDICLQNLPVVFCVDRAGLVGQDGATHQGVYDISYLSHLPNLKIFAPTNTTELSYMLEYALSLNSPVVIRYPNEKTTVERPLVTFDSGLWESVKDGDDLTILAVGPRALNLALEFAKDCEKSVKVVSARTIKPLDKEMLDGIKKAPIITIEENSMTGGFASAVLGYYSKNGDNVKVVSLGVADKFIEHGTIESQMAKLGLTKENLTEICKNI
jgi:1-deoxy-D-xylulose-5-phosphate synthase